MGFRNDQRSVGFTENCGNRLSSQIGEPSDEGHQGPDWSRAQVAADSNARALVTHSPRVGPKDTPICNGSRWSPSYMVWLWSLS